MPHTHKKQTPASVDTPPAGYLRQFADADGVMKTKDEAGVVRPDGSEVANTLGTSAEPVAIDGGGPPAAGDILVATAGLPTPAAGWQSPIGNSALPFLRIFNTAKLTDGDSPWAAAAGQCILVDLSSATADMIINLPDASASLNEEIVVKLVSAVGSYKVTLNPAGSDTINGAISYDLDTDYEWVRLRAFDLGGGVYMWGQVG